MPGEIVTAIGVIGAIISVGIIVFSIYLSHEERQQKKFRETLEKWTDDVLSEYDDVIEKLRE